MFFFSKRLKKSTKEEDQAFRDRMQEEKVSLKDGLAMVLSAYVTLVLPCLLILLGLAAVVFLLLM